MIAFIVDTLTAISHIGTRLYYCKYILGFQLPTPVIVNRSDPSKIDTYKLLNFNNISSFWVSFFKSN